MCKIFSSGLIYVILVFLLLFPVTVDAVFEDQESGVRAQGMGDAFTAVADDAEAIHWNPAGLSQLEHINISTFYKRLFSGIDGLHNFTLDIAIPYHKWGTFGVSVQQVGVQFEKERVVTLSHGLNLTKTFAQPAIT